MAQIVICPWCNENIEVDFGFHILCPECGKFIDVIPDPVLSIYTEIGRIDVGFFNARVQGNCDGWMVKFLKLLIRLIGSGKVERTPLHKPEKTKSAPETKMVMKKWADRIDEKAKE